MMSHATFICLSLRSLIRRSSSRFVRSGCQVWRSVLTIFLSISSPSSGLAPSTCSASFRVEGSQPLSSVVRTPDTDGRGRRGSEGKRVDDLDVAFRRARADPSMRSSRCVNANHIAEMRSIATSRTRSYRLKFCKLPWAQSELELRGQSHWLLFLSAGASEPDRPSTLLTSKASPPCFQAPDHFLGAPSSKPLYSGVNVLPPRPDQQLET